MKPLRTPALTACLCALVVSFAAAQVTGTGETVDGATNYARLDANFATGGDTSAGAFATLKKMGFKTVINLRTASEPGVDLAAEEKLVTASGLRYVGLPFSSSAPEASAIESFLRVARDSASQPVYLHCHSGQRANAFWLIKRVTVDGWTVEKAVAEAESLKLNPGLRDFAVAYLQKR